MSRMLSTLKISAQEITLDFLLFLGLTAAGTFGVVTLATWWM